jgi:hypothetical protein
MLECAEGRHVHESGTCGRQESSMCRRSNSCFTGFEKQMLARAEGRRVQKSSMRRRSNSCFTGFEKQVLVYAEGRRVQEFIHSRID